MANTAKALFAAGCFWGVEAQFRQVTGVTETAVGYSGGSTQEPSYEQVCGGLTGHAETVAVTFDSGRVSYEELLAVFWRSHDPTQGNRQVTFKFDRFSLHSRFSFLAHQPARVATACARVFRSDSFITCLIAAMKGNDRGTQYRSGIYCTDDGQLAMVR